MRKFYMTRKRLIGAGAGIAAVFAAAVVFFYVPALNRINNLKAGVEAVNAQIEEIERAAGTGAALAAGVRRLDERYQQLSTRFPAREEPGLAMLYEFAQRFSLEVITLTAQQKTPFQDAKKQNIVVDGRAGQRLTVSISMKGRYISVHDYIRAILTELPVQVTVERLRMTRGAAEAGALTVVLDITLYLLS